MIDNDTALAVLDACDRRRAERRRLLTLVSSGAATLGGLALLSACKGKGTPTPTPTPTPTTPPTPTPTSTAADLDILNFALNLEYLEAQFYSYAVYGAGLPGAQTAGTGTMGTVTGGRQVAFSDPLVAQYAREIAQDEAEHVALGGRGRRGRDVRSLCVGRDLPARRVHLRRCRGDRVHGRGAVAQPCLYRGRGRDPRRRSVSRRADPHDALPQGAGHTGAAVDRECRQDQRRARQPRRDERRRSGHRQPRRRRHVEHRAVRRQRHRLQPHDRASAQHRVPVESGGHQRRVFPQRLQRQHHDGDGRAVSVTTYVTPAKAGPRFLGRRDHDVVTDHSTGAGSPLSRGRRRKRVIAPSEHASPRAIPG